MPYTEPKDTPLVSPQRDDLIHHRPVGDKKNQDHDIHTDESNISGHEDHDANVDEDFHYLRQCLHENKNKWELVHATENLRVERRKDLIENEVFIRCQAKLPKIRKEVAFQAFSDIKTRKKWDQVMHNLKVIEEDKETGRAVLYYNVKTLPYMSTRDALI
jgi:hypothetical protein